MMVVPALRAVCRRLVRRVRIGRPVHPALHEQGRVLRQPLLRRRRLLLERGDFFVEMLDDRVPVEYQPRRQPQQEHDARGYADEDEGEENVSHWGLGWRKGWHHASPDEYGLPVRNHPLIAMDTAS